MSRLWTIALFVMLMVVQALSIASDVLPVHADDRAHGAESSLHLDADTDTDTDTDTDRKHAPHDADGLDHCHCHCHGSHLLMGMALPAMPLPAAGPDLPNYHSQHPSPHGVEPFRPPIV